ncbi:unnamed protein product [Xylocopa violacea]|uniref:Uncharacterized protein n=1 Tax=Xylocopa violacea TaxID=135666 RepID=A0ABP1PGE8_XYLVO
MLDLLSLETRARHGRAVSLRLTSDEEAACCRGDGLSGLLESMAAKSTSKDFRKKWILRREATRFPAERRRPGQCYERRLEVIREGRGKSEAYGGLRAKSRSWF